MRVLWLCGLPLEVQQSVLGNEDHGSQAAWSWITAHFPPPSGVDLHVACLWPEGTGRKNFEFGGAMFHLVPCPAKGRALLLFQRDTRWFRALFEELKPDVVHGWGTEDCFGLVARKLAPTRHVIGIQGLIKAYRRRIPMEARWFLVELSEWLTLRRARRVVAESGWSLEAARPLCPAAANLRVIEHPLRREFLAAEPSGGSGCRVLFVGAVNERKGILDALRAFARIGKENWSLHIIGSGTPEDEAAMWKAVAELGIGARFFHNSHLPPDRIIEAMQAASVFLLPTRIDTGPTSLKEALALGLWPVCYHNSGPGEYVRTFEFGSLAKDLDLEDLTATLGRAIETRPWLALGLREKLRRQTREAFARENAWAQLQNLYSEIAGTHA